MSIQLLKLRAEDSEDIQIISAMLQDSIVPVCDMVFQDDKSSFVMVSQRLRREAQIETERICCALTITGVKSIQTRGFDVQKTEQMLNLLALLLEGSQLTFVFAGDAYIRLELDRWAGLAEDFGEPWPVLSHPHH